MRSATWFGIAIIAAAHISAPAHAQTSDDSLKIYAVNIVKTPPFKKQFTGYGIYLGRGMVITAAHVVGHWPFFTHPRVLIAGQDLRANIIKLGSFEQIDLALLTVDETQLPVSLRLRRNPICEKAPSVGMAVVVVAPEETKRSQVISPLLIAPELRGKFDTLISTPEGSGMGVFDAERKCLLGIVSARVQKYNFQLRNRRLVGRTVSFAGYFVPASKIANFIPPEFRF
jgi:hypothetical protein